MTDTALIEGSAKNLENLLSGVASCIAEALQKSLGTEVQAAGGVVSCHDREGLTGAVEPTSIAVRFALSQAFEGHSMLLALPIKEAIRMAGMARDEKSDAITERMDHGTLEGSDQESFSKLTEELCAAAGGFLRERVKEPLGAGLREQSSFGGDSDALGCFGDETLVDYNFQLKVGENDETTCHLILAIGTAEIWNRGPLPGHEKGGGRENRVLDAIPRVNLQQGEVPFEEIPEAPTRGKLSSYLHQLEIGDVIRRACRRVGLDLERHGRNEIPNPGAHRNQVVLMDVPPGEERRFEWCKRLKDSDANISVVLILHHPNRSRVLQAFMTKVDAIIGWPMTEPVLSKKLTAILDAAESHVDNGPEEES